MKKLVSNLMAVNKLVIFLENLIDEDVDLDIFTTKIIQDIEFIKNTADNIFDEYISNVRLYDSENILKLYFSTLKRNHKLLMKIHKHHDLFNKHTKDLLNTISQEIDGKIHRMKDFDYRANILKVDKQVLNEEEYNLLLRID